eukprot:1158449-Pelagomonas_calceolata.AAC.3
MLWKEDERLGLGGPSGNPCAQASSGHVPSQHHPQPGAPASSRSGPLGAGGPGPSSSAPRPGQARKHLCCCAFGAAQVKMCAHCTPKKTGLPAQQPCQGVQGVDIKAHIIQT